LKNSITKICHCCNSLTCCALYSWCTLSYGTYIMDIIMYNM